MPESEGEVEGRETLLVHSKWDGRDISLFLFVSHTGPVCIISQYLSKLLFFLKKKKNRYICQGLCYRWWSFDSHLYMWLETDRCFMAPVMWEKVAQLVLSLVSSAASFSESACGSSWHGRCAFPESVLLFLVVLLHPVFAVQSLAVCPAPCCFLCSAGLCQRCLLVLWWDSAMSRLLQRKCWITIEHCSKERSTASADHFLLPGIFCKDAASAP